MGNLQGASMTYCIRFFIKSDNIYSPEHFYYIDDETNLIDYVKQNIERFVDSEELFIYILDKEDSKNEESILEKVKEIIKQYKDLL
jgi:hypothetical protein